jgi:hypothetical protein
MAKSGSLDERFGCDALIAPKGGFISSVIENSAPSPMHTSANVRVSRSFFPTDWLPIVFASLKPNQI